MIATWMARSYPGGMVRTVDVAVIGGGVAGVAAALAGARLGARVALVRAAPGATSMSGGGWIGALSEGLARALREAGLPHGPCEQPLPHPSGELRGYSWAPETHLCPRIDAETLVCGIAGLPGFHASALARLWSSDAEGVAQSVTLELEGTPRAGWSPVALAALIERDFILLARPLASATRARSLSRVVIPAVLGLGPGTRVLPQLRAAIGVEVVEALGMPPSVPGWRLGRALDRALHAAGVEVIPGRVVRNGNGGRRVARVQVRRTHEHEYEHGSDRIARESRADGAGLEIAAAYFVLATGKFAGGGISGDGVLRETALGCPVWIDHLGQRFDSAQPLPLTNAERSARQPILEAGVHVDDRGRPRSPTGDVVYEDVIIAGSVRAGVTTAGLGLGGAAEDGRLAGERAARAAA